MNFRYTESLESWTQKVIADNWASWRDNEKKTDIRKHKSGSQEIRQCYQGVTTCEITLANGDQICLQIHEFVQEQILHKLSY